MSKLKKLIFNKGAYNLNHACGLFQGQKNLTRLFPLLTAFLLYLSIINWIMTNLLVSTTNADERARLEQEFPLRDGYFHLPPQQSSTLEAIFRTISFRKFQNTPPPIVQKIMALLESSLSGIFNLDILREIMAMLSATNSTIALYKQYFVDINGALCEDFVESKMFFAETLNSPNDDNDQVFLLAERGQMMTTRHLEADLQEFDLKPKKHSPIQFSEKTQLPSYRGHNPQEEAPLGNELNSNPSQFFYSAESYYGNNEWWKQENHPNDSSKEISRFDCRAGTPLHQKSIGGLVIEQLRYDLKREIEIGKDINKHQQQAETNKYKKLMKDKLLTAKLKKRKKK